MRGGGGEREQLRQPQIVFENLDRLKIGVAHTANNSLISFTKTIGETAVNNGQRLSSRRFGVLNEQTI